MEAISARQFKIAFVNNWRINMELIWIWNAGHHSASMVKASTMVKYSLLTCSFFSVFSSFAIRNNQNIRNCQHQHQRAHNLIFRFYDGVAAMRELHFFFFFLYCRFRFVIFLYVFFLSMEIIIQACNLYAYWTRMETENVIRICVFAIRMLFLMCVRMCVWDKSMDIIVTCASVFTLQNS